MIINNTNKWLGGVIIAVIIGVGLLWAGSRAIEYFEKNQEVIAAQNAEEEKTAIGNIGNTQKIENQKIITIDSREITLENGVKLPITDSSKNSCQVGDMIKSYDDEKDSLICSNLNSSDSNQSGENRFFYYPSPYSRLFNSTNFYNWGRSSSMDNYFKGQQYLSANGYNYDQGTKSYSHPSGNSYMFNSGSSSVTKSKSSSKSGTATGKSSTGGVSGHGGGAGTSGKGGSS